MVPAPQQPLETKQLGYRLRCGENPVQATWT
jgi:hypothetical protein